MKKFVLNFTRRSTEHKTNLVKHIISFYKYIYYK